MATNSVELELDLADAIRRFDALPEDIDDGAREAIRQLALLAEGETKKEAPEGAGQDVHMRDTVRTDFDRNGLQARIFASKRVGPGILLAGLVTGAFDPSWDPDDPPPVPALMPWAAAKMGDPNAAGAVSQKLVQEGMSENPFVDRARENFDQDVLPVAVRQISEALGD